MASAILVVLAVDGESERVLAALKLPGLLIISAEELEDDDLKKLKEQRNSSEYCWTLKPVLLLHLYESFGGINIFVYLDSDLFFFDNPTQLFRRNDKWSILLTTHKVNRKANGGFVVFRRSSHAYKALKWWRERCLEWCYYYYDHGRFADQGYLDFLRGKYKGVIYLEVQGANVATWNFFKYDLTLKDGSIYVDRSRLIFYHFSGLRMKRYGNSVALYGAEVPCILCRIYSKALRNAIKDIEEVNKEVTKYFYMGL